MFSEVLFKLGREIDFLIRRQSKEYTDRPAINFIIK